VAVSDLFTTPSPVRPNVAVMDIRITSTVLEIATKDLARALDFYRLLGLDVPPPDGPHVEVELPGGNRLAFDDEEIIAGMHPGWAPPTQQGRLAVAFEVGEPKHVDALFEKVTGAGHPGALKPFDAPWGQRYATVTDPDGTSVDFFCPLP
jgi:catechol 2,3-dioxygenase-like lactoylglutathione lyase family enzyme